ncbi:probable 54S ribosomal protein L6, mitochondrial [Saccharomycodes ludwigii]|uniref:Large ribosomal subunit protein uL6m n=1 Tax=Saccharomycodes ludwigii TaxID=36035 RepID=A0A376B2H9_9ASCO|nr:hypothetical protein SCDLUD_004503 [Saccharomycodes ludwigii]KAH3899080.1 hypothetical protein SCDLUD_004503 [Saccharomycodes ludwigii]SSD58340.1 probable 54S ribosomal protein L6, mitochondrial [Saccharomycodes ludwigii]
MLSFKRSFHLTRQVQSHIGKAPILLTPETKVEIIKISTPKILRKPGLGKSLTFHKLINIKGPLGELAVDIPNFIKIDNTTNKNKHHTINISIEDENNKLQKSMWGTIRSLINNSIIGVNEGHLSILKFVGTGYRCQILKDSNFISVKVGASVTQGLHIPPGIKVSSPVPTSLIIEGCDKQQVGLFAANLRKFHPPEPYKGKGIYVNDETIKLKDKKIK